MTELIFMGFVPVSKVLPCGGTAVLRTPLYPQGLPRMTHLQSLLMVSSELLICWRAFSGFSEDRHELWEMALTSWE